jgi:hypothetical protein
MRVRNRKVREIVTLFLRGCSVSLLVTELSYYTSSYGDEVLLFNFLCIPQLRGDRGINEKVVWFNNQITALPHL